MVKPLVVAIYCGNSKFLILPIFSDAGNFVLAC